MIVAVVVVFVLPLVEHSEVLGYHVRNPHLYVYPELPGRDLPLGSRAVVGNRLVAEFRAQIGTRRRREPKPA